MSLRERTVRHAVALTSLTAIVAVGTGVGLLFGVGYALIAAGGLLYIDIRT